MSNDVCYIICCEAREVSLGWGGRGGVRRDKKSLASCGVEDICAILGVSENREAGF